MTIVFVHLDSHITHSVIWIRVICLMHLNDVVIAFALTFGYFKETNLDSILVDVTSRSAASNVATHLASINSPNFIDLSSWKLDLRVICSNVRAAALLAAIVFILFEVAGGAHNKIGESWNGVNSFILAQKVSFRFSAKRTANILWVLGLLCH